jgi:hypothetical protein
VFSTIREHLSTFERDACSSSTEGCVEKITLNEDFIFFLDRRAG